MTHPILIPRSAKPADWPEISSAFHDLTYEQSLTYAQAAANRIGAQARFLCLEDAQGTPVAAACLRIKQVPVLNRGVAWIAAGPLTCRHDHARPDPVRLQAILAALRDHVHEDGHVLRLRFPAPALHDTEALTDLALREGFAPTDHSPPYQTVLVDLETDEEALMKALHGKWRNPLRNALKAGLELETGPIATLSKRFHVLYEQVQAVKGFRPNIPPEFYYPLSGPDFDHEVLIARKDGADVGAMTIGHAGSNAIYLFGATTDAGRGLNAGHYLMWQAMLHCRARGAKYLDLGGIDPDMNPSVTRFKQRTGGMDVTAPGPYEAWPKGLTGRLIGLAETLHGKLKGKA